MGTCEMYLGTHEVDKGSQFLLTRTCGVDLSTQYVVMGMSDTTRDMFLFFSAFILLFFILC